jgi:hypothetical protein
MKVARRFIMDGQSDRKGWNRRQTTLLGLKWPLESGWIDRTIGLEITDDAAAEFLALKNWLSPITKKNYAKRARRAAARLAQDRDHDHETDLAHLSSLRERGLLN